MLLKKSEFRRRYGPRDTPMSQATYHKWRSHNRRKGTKYIEPLDWLKGVRQ